MDVVMVVVVTVLSFTPVIEGRGTALGWDEPRRSFVAEARDRAVTAAVCVMLGEPVPTGE